MRLHSCLALWAFVVSLTLNAGIGLTFEPNRGQTVPDVDYIARTTIGTAFVTDRGVTFRGSPTAQSGFELVGADLSAGWTAEAATDEKASYYIGRDPSKWVQDVPHFARLIHRQVYPGTDLALYGTDDRLEYEFRLAPHADPGLIRIKLTGARAVSIGPDGALIIDTLDGELRHQQPVLTEDLPDGSRRSLTGAFRILGPDEVGFSVGPHDPSLALSIDPVLEASSYFGGSGDDLVVATDGNGNFVGSTTSIDVPGAQFARRNGTNLFMKLGQQTIVIGGSGDMTVTSAAFGPLLYNGQTNVVVGGYSDATDLPTNLGFGGQGPALQPNYAGGASDGFLAIIYPLSNGPFGSYVPTLTYIGGPGDDRVNAVAIDPNSSGTGLAIAGSTTGNGLPQSPYTGPIQASPAGGVDAFVMTVIALGPSQGVLLTASTYLGGSGDDTALGVAVNFGVVYVTGETASADFPEAGTHKSVRRGDSDAFVAELTGNGATLASSTLFGGGGSDRGTATTLLFNGNVAVAGVTTSTDLPLTKPTQKAYGGGASDAFLAQFTPDLSAVVASTYIGGSDADEATSIASAPPNTIVVGGWTASKDFPVVNAVQKQYGGGVDDGFLVHFDDDGSIYQATFFGGSHSDEVLGVAAPAVGKVSIAGKTTSPNLPLENAVQTGLKGSSDGFVAEVTSNSIAVSPITGAKDLRGTVFVPLGNSQLASATHFTITSSDPSKVQVAVDFSSPGQKAVTLLPTGNGQSLTVYVDCLTDKAIADLTFSAPAYTSRKVPVSCLPQAVIVFAPGLATSPLQTHIGATPITIGVYLVPNLPSVAGGYAGSFQPRPGMPSVTVQAASSNSAVGTISTPSSVLPLAANQFPFFTPLTIGQTDLTFSAGDIPVIPTSTRHVNVGGSYAPLQPLPVPSGFESAINLHYVAGNLPRKQTTLKSKDSARMVLSLDPTKRGSASVTLPIGQNGPIWIQALGSSGDVPLSITVPGEPDVTGTVHLTEPVTVLSVTNTGQPLQLVVGSAASASFDIESSGPGFYPLMLNPGSAAISFSLKTSNAKAVSIAPATVKLAPGTIAGGDFRLTGTAAGSTVLTLANSAKIPAGGPFGSVSVNVTQGKLSLSNVEVGKDLAAPMRLTLPVQSAADTLVTAVISDPSLALLSLDNTSPGAAQLTTIIPAGQTSSQFYVYGLAASGQPQVKATLTGGSTTTATVSLEPSGFYWSTDSVAAGFQGPVFAPNIQSGPLDPATLLPVGVQPLRPGVSGQLNIANSNAAVAVPNSSVLTLPNTNFQITVKAPGNTIFTLKQPAGFSTPSALQKLAVTVAKPQLTVYFSTLGKNTQTTLGVGGLVGTPTVTVTSSDPSKVRLSTDPAKLGSGSLTTSKLVYLQALSSSGAVAIKVSSPGYTSGSGTFALVPTGLAISLDGIFIQNGNLTTTTQSMAVHVRVNLDQPGGLAGSSRFIPGLSPLKANITSSNKGVAVITGSPITIPVDPNQQFPSFPGATILQVAAGESTIGISQPAGFTSVGNDSVTLEVTTPSLVGNNLTIAKDTLTPTNIGLAQGVNPASVNTPVMLTSSDATRVLLSPDAMTSPSASITVSFAAGSQGANFYIHALADDGTVTIQASASGYGNGSSVVQLVPLGFGFNTFQPVPIHAIIHGPPGQLNVNASAITQGFANSSVFMLRPGIPPISIDITSSDPKIVSVTPQHLMFSGSTINGSLTFTPLKPGTATISLREPAGYAIVPSQGQLSIVADTAKLSFNTTSLQIGHDLQTQISVFAEAPQQNTTLTLKSSDPSLLLVSTDATKLGQSSIVPSQGMTVFAQALAGSGNATLSLSSPGYQTATLPVSLLPAGAYFTNSQGPRSVLANSGVRQEPVALAALDPVSLKFIPGNQYPRPGTNLSVAVSSSDPKVVTIATPIVQFPAQPIGSNNPAAGIQPVGAGTAVVTLGAVAGNPAAASGDELIYNVSEPELSIPAFTLGVDLEAPVQITLGSSVPTPTADTLIMVNAFNLGLGVNRGDLGQQSISVKIPRGQRISQPFYVQALSAFGSTSLNYGGGSFPNFTTPVMLSQTAFVIQEASSGQPLDLKVGGTASLTIVPESSLPSVSIRAGATPISIAIASTNPSVATASPSQVTLKPGDQKATFSIQGLTAGTATVKLLGTGYDFGQPQASIQVVVK